LQTGLELYRAIENIDKAHNYIKKILEAPMAADNLKKDWNNMYA
jgi:hypothetical protein